jgi:uncharacterized protein with GYD domain
MTTYIMLGNFTDQGIRSVKDTTKRADALKERAKSLGVTVKEYTGRLANTTPSLSSMRLTKRPITAFGLEFGKAGNHRTQTLRAFSQAEMGAVLNKVT